MRNALAALAAALFLACAPAAAQEIAAKIASKPPLAVRYGKRLLKLAQRQQLAEHLDVCSAFQAICHKTEDHQEALTAFFEKRPGKFTGK